MMPGREEIVNSLEFGKRNLYIASAFSNADEFNLNPEIKKRLGESDRIDVSEIQGYEAGNILAQAMSTADSVAPIDASAVLRLRRLARVTQ